MFSRNVVILGIAVFLGLVAVLLANSYFSGLENRTARASQQGRFLPVVVAAQDLGFGTPLSQQNLRLASWPANSVPVGAFRSIQDAARNRVALRPIVVGEPVLASKVSGLNGRATLSANLPPGTVAYSIPISDISGVGGFVRPGDSVNVLLTRQMPGEGASNNDKMTDIVLEAVPVLGIDQVSDENKTDPAVGKAATLQVDAYGAQKLALASQLGVLSLALRNVSDHVTGSRSTVTPRDLTAGNFYVPQRRSSAAAATVSVPSLAQATPANRAPRSTPPAMTRPTMTVFRGSKPTDYEVKGGL